VIALNDNQVLQEFFTKDGIEQKLLGENKRRFNQSASTPFMVEPLASLVGPTGNTIFVKQVLDGKEEIPTNIDVYAARLLKYLAHPTDFHSNHIKSNLDVDDYIRGWRKAREFTSSGTGEIGIMSNRRTPFSLSATLRASFNPWKEFLSTKPGEC
jgi:hypothetical protein